MRSFLIKQLNYGLADIQPSGGGKAAITGDFVLTGDEVNPVITALCTHGIELTALRSHMVAEQPADRFGIGGSSRCTVRETVA